MRVEAAGLGTLSPDLSPARFTPRPAAGLRLLRSFVMRPQGCRCPLASDGRDLGRGHPLESRGGAGAGLGQRERAPTAVALHGADPQAFPPPAVARHGLDGALPGAVSAPPAQSVSCATRSLPRLEQGCRSASDPRRTHGPRLPHAQSCLQPELPSAACPEHWPSEWPCLRGRPEAPGSPPDPWPRMAGTVGPGPDQASQGHLPEGLRWGLGRAGPSRTR